jgi:hypothetical protein
MEDWMLGDEWDWEPIDDDDFMYEVTDDLADRFFLSDNDYLPNAGEDYRLGYLKPRDWWPLVNQLDEMVDLAAVLDVLDNLEPHLHFPGLPSQLLEAPTVFLEHVLAGHLPLEPSGKRVGSRTLVKIALDVTRLLQQFPATAQAAVRGWADAHRGMMGYFPYDELGADDLLDLLSNPDLPPTVTGFGLVLVTTLMHWSELAEESPGLTDLPDPALYDDLLAQWEALPDGPLVTQQGAGEAETLFAQGQLAHLLAQLGVVEGVEPDHLEDGEAALLYSRLSRAILWLHHQCRHCPEREEVACQVATHWPERPVPLIAAASEIANTGRIEGCVRM